MQKMVFETAENTRLAVTAETQKQLRNNFNKLALDMEKKSKALENKTNISSQMKKEYLDDFSKDIRKESKTIFKKLQGKIENDMGSVAMGAVVDMDEWCKHAGISMGTALHNIPMQTVQNVANGKVYGGDWTLSKAIWGCDQKVAKDINTIVSNGIAANMSAYDIAKDLEKYVDPSAKKDWAWNKVYPGTSKRIDYNAQRLARTMVNHAYQQSTVQACKQNPFVTGVEWISACTNRTCDLCLSRHKHVFSKNDVPLDHPNGMCTLVAYIEKNMDDISNELADWANGKPNEELDEWNANLHGGTLEKTTVFSNLQKKYLGKYGYSPDNMPTDFTEWSHKLDSDDKSELLAIKNMNQAEHPFQELNKWYDKYLSEDNLEPKITFEPYAKSDAKKLYGVKGNKNKIGGTFSPDDYSQARKDKALWSYNMEEIDDALRPTTSKTWIDAAIEERQGGYYYTAGSGHMNRPLRQGLDWDYEDSRGASHIKGLTDMIDKTTYNQDVWLQRGVDSGGSKSFLHLDSSDDIYSAMSNVDKLKHKLVGNVYTDDAFLSCGAAKGKGFNDTVIYNIYCPKGTKMIYAEPFSSYGNGDGLNWDGISKQSSFGSEFEVILQRGSSFRITDVKTNGDKIFIDMEVVAQEPLAMLKNH